MNPKSKVPVTYEIKEPELTRKPSKDYHHSSSYPNTNSTYHSSTKTRQTSSSPAPVATKAQPVVHKDVGLPTKVRFPLRKIPVADPLWNMSTLCTDRDELLCDQDNEISKAKYSHTQLTQPVYQPHDQIPHYHKRSLPQKSLKMRPPNKTSGQITNIDLALGKWNPIPYAVHPDHMKDDLNRDIMKFGTLDHSIDPLARPRAYDKSSELFHKLFRPSSPVPVGKILILKQEPLLFSPRTIVHTYNQRETVRTAPVEQQQHQHRRRTSISSPTRDVTATSVGVGLSRKSLASNIRPKSASSAVSWHHSSSPRIHVDRSRATIQARVRGPIPPLV